MQASALETYVPTLLRWLAVGGGVLILTVLFNYALQRLGVRAETARGYALIMPWIIGFLIFQLYPFAYSLYLSFTEYNIFQPPRFIGLENYREMLGDTRTFW
ncbi:MAG: hypothetical protein RQ748_12210, partial [Elusimicrobiales bacterium]|nr:hypothetical protein [Elusimicrobiales bacterium]